MSGQNKAKEAADRAGGFDKILEAAGGDIEKLARGLFDLCVSLTGELETRARIDRMHGIAGAIPQPRIKQGSGKRSVGRPSTVPGNAKVRANIASAIKHGAKLKDNGVAAKYYYQRAVLHGQVRPEQVTDEAVNTLRKAISDYEREEHPAQKYAETLGGKTTAQSENGKRIIIHKGSRY